MSEMSKVEEVAMALAQAELYDGDGLYDWYALTDSVADKYRAMARAAIEAMRKPTEAMRDRYNDPDVVGYGPDGSNHDLVWNAGIDAALKD